MGPHAHGHSDPGPHPHPPHAPEAGATAKDDDLVGMPTVVGALQSQVTFW